MIIIRGKRVNTLPEIRISVRRASGPHDFPLVYLWYLLWGMKLLMETIVSFQPIFCTEKTQQLCSTYRDMCTYNQYVQCFLG